MTQASEEAMENFGLISDEIDLLTSMYPDSVTVGKPCKYLQI